MKRIDDITSEPKQSFSVPLDNKETVAITLEYKPQQIGWFVTINYKNRTRTDMRITNSPNMIRELKNTWQIGLRCDVDDGREPMFPTDFSEGKARLYVLDQEEVETVENAVYIKENV